MKLRCNTLLDKVNRIVFKRMESMNNSDQNYVKWFRNAAPYINAHRGKTVVLMFGGEAVTHANFANIIHDISFKEKK